MYYQEILLVLMNAEKQSEKTTFPIPKRTIVCDRYCSSCLNVMVAGKARCGLDGQENKQEFIWLGVLRGSDGFDIDQSDADDPSADDVGLVQRSHGDFVLVTTAAQLFGPLMDERHQFKDPVFTVSPPRWARRLAAVLPYIDPPMGDEPLRWAIRDSDLERICIESFPAAGRG